MLVSMSTQDIEQYTRYVLDKDCAAGSGWIFDLVERILTALTVRAIWQVLLVYVELWRGSVAVVGAHHPRVGMKLGSIQYMVTRTGNQSV
jgi:hypothetical protein